MSFDSLPLDLWEHELLPRLDSGDRFVLRFVSAFLRDVLAAVARDLVTSNPSESFAKNGYLALLRWDQASSRPCMLTSDSVVEAVAGEHLELVRYLVDERGRGGDLRSRDLVMCCLKGNVAMVRYLSAHVKAARTDHCLLAAASKSHLDVIKVLVFPP